MKVSDSARGLVAGIINALDMMHLDLAEFAIADDRGGVEFQRGLVSVDGARREFFRYRLNPKLNAFFKDQARELSARALEGDLHVSGFFPRFF